MASLTGQPTIKRLRKSQRAPPSSSPEAQSPKILAKACNACRAKKIRCDAVQPRCSTCTLHERECVYQIEPPRKRPTFSKIQQLQKENEKWRNFIIRLKRSSRGEREFLLGAVTIDDDGIIHLHSEPEPEPEPAPENENRPGGRRPLRSSVRRTYLNLNQNQNQNQGERQGSIDTPCASSEDELDIAHFISVDEAGKPGSFGPSSALHNPTITAQSKQAENQENIRNGLIANAALQRQLEHSIARLSSIDGTPIGLAMHLLEVHWQRQHHSFLLTYRPAVMRDLQHGGPNCSLFLLNAIFACSSKFSANLQVRDVLDDSATTGRRFFRRCDELLAKDSLLIRPNITTVIGLLLLGSTYNARGEISKGWLYTGYALRMVYDLGLHLDPKETFNNPEDVEIRRRVFWGAFVCDKLQSLYLGRPVAINLRDSQVSRDFLDLYEEKELYTPAMDPRAPPPPPPPLSLGAIPSGIPLHSVSTFQHLCLLSKIMTTIINRFYVVGATFSNAQASLHQVELALQRWRENLSPELDFQPWAYSSPLESSLRQPPNVMILHNLYHSLIILVHRPFISDGHLRSSATPERSWERCTAAARNITSIALAYQSSFGLSGAPYVLGYTIYVACTIHVRNAAARDQYSREHLSLLIASLKCLDELCLANPGVAKPARIIRRLIEVNELDVSIEETPVVDYSIPGFDVDAILNMFPISNGSDADMGVSGLRPGLDIDLPPDPLFGLMDGPVSELDFATTTMLFDNPFPSGG